MLDAQWLCDTRTLSPSPTETFDPNALFYYVRGIFKWYQAIARSILFSKCMELFLNDPICDVCQPAIFDKIGVTFIDTPTCLLFTCVTHFFYY